MHSQGKRKFPRYLLMPYTAQRHLRAHCDCGNSPYKPYKISRLYLRLPALPSLLLHFHIVLQSNIIIHRKGKELWEVFLIHLNIYQLLCSPSSVWGLKRSKLTEINVILWPLQVIWYYTILINNVVCMHVLELRRCGVFLLKYFYYNKE